MERFISAANSLSIVLLLLAVGLVTGCASLSAGKHTESSGPIRRADFRKVPELRSLESYARDLAAEMYPKMGALLLIEPFPPLVPFDLIVRPLKSGNTGEAHTRYGRIYINSDYLVGSSNAVEGIRGLLVHEMAHLVVESRTTDPGKPIELSPEMACWNESLADYVRFKLLGIDGKNCPECDSLYPHYLSGYSCGAAFLLYMDSKFGPSFVPGLVACLRRNGSVDAYFVEATKSSLDHSWEDFQKTEAFLPVADEAWTLQQQLGGFRAGIPPKDLSSRLDRLVDQNTNAFLVKTLQSAKLDRTTNASPRANWFFRLSLYLYLNQPGGSANEFVLGLGETGELPWFTPTDKGRLTMANDPALFENRSFPRRETITLHKQADSSIYHYQVVRESSTEGWKLEKAWRTSEDGSRLEDSSVPD